jgi:hypothetical protein
MLETYQGVLRGARIEWTGDAQRELPSEEGMRVHVTLLERVVLSAPVAEQGQRMAAALERLAACRALEGITDPAAWERETRQDRPLPDRDD